MNTRLISTIVVFGVSIVFSLVALMVIFGAVISFIQAKCSRSRNKNIGTKE
jgi:hypothetical protein